MLREENSKLKRLVEEERSSEKKFEAGAQARVVMRMLTAYGASLSQACRLAQISRSLNAYRICRPTQEALRRRVCEVAQPRPRFDYRRVHVMLVREGWPVNMKRVRRLYRLESLQLRRKLRRRKHGSQHRGIPPPASRAYERWSMDFVHDALVDGRAFRVLTVIDQMESLERGVTLDLIRPGKPTENGFIESFNSKLRDECLNANQFLSIEDAKSKIEAWRTDYNLHRPHSALRQLTTSEYLRRSVTEGKEAADF